MTPRERFYAITDAGRIRQNNEDAFQISDNGRILIVADGMGGQQAGEVAAKVAVETVAAFLAARQDEATQPEVNSVLTMMTEALQAAHRKVTEMSAGRLEYQGMAATLVAALLLGDSLCTCHVGDVRCYLVHNSDLEQVTRDHSTVGAMVRLGQLTSEEARKHPRKNEVQQAIGMEGPIIPEVNTRTVRSGDVVLLCSDGLWEALSDKEIGSIMIADHSIRDRAKQLVDRANRAGGYDNITVILYEHA